MNHDTITPAKLAFTVVVSALIAFVLGFSRSEGEAAPAAAVATAPSTAVTELAEANWRLNADVQRATAKFEALQAEHDRLLDERANASVARADGMIGVPFPRHMIQETILNNLKKLAAARDQFQQEHGRAPTSIEEIVRADGYLKRLTPFDGEDYTSLSMEQGRMLVVTTLSGVTVQYGEGTGDNATTRIDYPPAIARMKAAAAVVRPAAKAAYEAYRMANGGKDPDDFDKLMPFFATPQQRADFMEFREAQKAAKGQ